MEIFWAVFWFLVLGLLCGVLLAVAGRFLEVKKDPKEEEIAKILPGANCGGCGYSGCAQLAEKIAKGEAKTNACTVGGAECAEKIAAVMGVKAEAGVRMRAQVMCSGTYSKAKRKYVYDGEPDCNAAMKLGCGDKLCPNGCIGLGSCVAHCPTGAISVEDGVASVDYHKCIGCGKCASVCPKHIIKLIPYEAGIWVGCSSLDKGAIVKTYCEVGCFGCKMCERACEHNAIHVTDNVAQIDYALCVQCGKCAEVCPRKIIVKGKRINK